MIILLLGTIVWLRKETKLCFFQLFKASPPSSNFCCCSWEWVSDLDLLMPELFVFSLKWLKFLVMLDALKICHGMSWSEFILLAVNSFNGARINVSIWVFFHLFLKLEAFLIWRYIFPFNCGEFSPIFRNLFSFIFPCSLFWNAYKVVVEFLGWFTMCVIFSVMLF